MSDSKPTERMRNFVRSLLCQLEVPTELIDVSQELLRYIDERDALYDSREFLDALECAGVDNWDGYCYAVEILEGDNNE